ncbi:MAG TPA: biotin/lipoyl-containing protein [Terriglobia bacterium]|nr:biotin/lipoyl-containing protein [Terriglobia bacterium]
MKFDIKLRAGTETTEHRLELPTGTANHASGGQLQFSLDGDATMRAADWAEVAPGVYSILLDGRSYEACVTVSPEATAAREFSVTVGTRQYSIELQDPRERRHGGITGAHQGPQEILAPMPGKIVKVLVEENQQVAAGAGLVVIEAMKMQNELRAPRPGRVEKVYVEAGVGVETGAKLVRLAS